MKPIENALPKSDSPRLSRWKSFFLFLLLNFFALFVGVLLQGEGPNSAWYDNQLKAPWTPPGWVFGVAWFSIMFFFAIYLSRLAQVVPIRKWISLYFLQWGLNVSWNLFFFNLHLSGIALADILLLTAVIALFYFRFWRKLGAYSFFLLPYLLWLLIAVSLNAYFWWMN